MTTQTRADGTPMSQLGSECADIMGMNGRLQSSRLPERFRIHLDMTPEQVATGAMKEIIRRGAASCIAENKDHPTDGWLFQMAKVHLGELVSDGTLLPDDTIIEAAEDVLKER